MTMKPNPNAPTEKSFVFSKVAQVFPTIPSAYKPRADSNIKKIADSTLYVRTMSGNEYNGRGRGAWLLILMTVIVSYLYLYGAYLAHTNSDFTETAADVFVYAVVTIGVFLLISSWIFYYWRTELPICFNRQTRLVSIWFKNQLVQTNWDEIEAHVKVLSAVSASGTPYREAILYYNAYVKEIPYSIPIPASFNWDKHEIEGAYMIWEYIRVFMEEGKDKLPPLDPPRVKHELSSWKQAFSEFNPFPIIKPSSDTLGWKLFNIVIFPFEFAFMFIAIPADLIYMGLDKILPRKKIPKSLRTACEANSD